ncbi:MAG: hypothetical protein IKO07_12425 [Clostridia bacterium]|nr:hypothetical protein [Clostridia bacterium]
MEYGFSILMFFFSAALLIYAGILAVTKDYTLLPRRARVSVKPKNSKVYAFQIAKAVALAALAPALGGLAGLWNGAAGAAVLIAGLVACLWLSTKIVKNV